MEYIGYAAVVILGIIVMAFGVVTYLAGASDPQGSEEASRMSMKGCGVIIVGLIVVGWAIWTTIVAAKDALS